MTRLDLDPDLERLGEALHATTTIDLAREERAARTPRSRPRPRVLAGSTLGLAGIGAALVLALGGTEATSPAYAITQKGDGSVLVTFNFAGHKTLMDADRRLRADYDETILVSEAPGPATVKGAINCTPVTGLDAGAKTPVKVLLGADGTGMVPSGNTGAGTVHLTGCYLYNDAGPSNTGNTGNG